MLVTEDLDWKFVNSFRLEQIRPEQIRLGQIRLGQIRPGQIRPGQIRFGQIRLGQIRPGQICPGQIRLGQIRPGQIRPEQIRPLADSGFQSQFQGIGFNRKQDSAGQIRFDFEFHSTPSLCRYTIICIIQVFACVVKNRMLSGLKTPWTGHRKNSKMELNILF
jgi:hypothetical protein